MVGRNKSALFRHTVAFAPEQRGLVPAYSLLACPANIVRRGTRPKAIVSYDTAHGGLESPAPS